MDSHWPVIGSRRILEMSLEELCFLLVHIQFVIIGSLSDWAHCELPVERASQQQIPRGVDGNRLDLDKLPEWRFAIDETIALPHIHEHNLIVGHPEG